MVFPGRGRRLSRRGRWSELLEPRQVLDSTVVFNEVMYHPADNQQGSEWVELHNQMAVDMDLSNWSLTGIDFRFPEGTILPGRGYLVVARDPQGLAATNPQASIMGPFSGQLNNGGESLELRNGGGRVMDRLNYGDAAPWPAAADGGGVSLAKRNPQAGSEDPANWAASLQPDGTPGSENFPVRTVAPVQHELVTRDDNWLFDARGVNLGAAWREPEFVANWSSGQGILYSGQFPTLAPPSSWQLPAATLPQIANPSFESNTQPGVGYGAVDGWNSLGTTGINPSSDGGAPFVDNGIIPDQRQVAFIQGRGSLSQVITGLEVGRDYWLEVHYNARSCCGADPSFSVSLAGQSLLAPQTVLPVGEGEPFHVALLPFTATATSGQLLLRNVNGTGDNSLLLDGVAILPRTEGALPVANGSFESSGALAAELGFPTPNRIAGWQVAGTGRVGIVNGGAGELQGALLPDGQHGLALDGSVSITQTLSGLVPGQSYELRLHALSAAAANPLSVLGIRLDGQLVRQTTVPSPGAFVIETLRFTATDGTSQLSISQLATGAQLFVDQVMLRHVDSPLVTEVQATGTTQYFRTEFQFDGDPRLTELTLRHFIDDGAIFYLNGQEILRERMPPGATGHLTTATEAIADPSWSLPLTLPGTAVRTGRNVLAVEVHQAAVPDTDMAFGLELSAVETPLRPEDYVLSAAINEWSGAGGPTHRVELMNFGTSTIAAGDLRLSLEGQSITLPEGPLTAGSFWTVDLPSPLEEDALILLSHAQTGTPIDAVHVGRLPQARYPDGQGPYFHVRDTSFGAPNQVSLESAIVINELMYHALPEFANPGIPPTYTESQRLGLNATWRYNDSGESLPPNWPAAMHPVGGNWKQGAGLLGFETGPVIEPGLGTSLATGRAVYYLETDFTLSNDDLAADQFLMRHAIDDGAAFFMNGTEFARFNLPDGTLTATTLASRSLNNATLSEALVIPRNLLRAGTNRLSIQLHQSSATSSDLIAGAQVTIAQVTQPGTPSTPFRENEEEWIELYNKSDQAVTLAGWQLSGGVEYQFPTNTVMPPHGYLVVARDPAAVRQAYPDAVVVGPFAGRLADGGESIVLRNGDSNPVDEVRYFDGGRWPEAADGGGASLELIDPHADNNVAENWAASSTLDATSWRTYTLRGIAVNPPNLNVPDLFDELLLGLLDRGEVLLDDLRLIEDPDGRRIERLQNGSFSTDAFGAAPATWRWIGNHGDTVVVPDPDNPANHVLRVVATGQTEHMHNHGETTLADRAQIVDGATYELSFRARWVHGSPQLNSRLYFARMAQTTILDTPDRFGTPGRANSRRVANAGPVYSELSHTPLVPRANQPVTVRVQAEDPDGVTGLTLHYAVNGGPFQAIAMARESQYGFVAEVPGQTTGSVVQFYVAGRDELGAESTFPANGIASRALFEVAGDLNARDAHTVRLIMTRNDSSTLHESTNVMSNGRLGATLIYNDSEVFYDVGVRLRASGYGRQGGLAGFNVDFDPQQLFRGVHGSISFDRGVVLSSGTGSGGVQGVPGASPHELLIYQFANHAGGIGAMYDDVVYVDAPRSANTGFALLKMARHTDVFLDSQFPSGSDGSLFKYELIYHSTATVDGNPESLKRPPGGVIATDITNLGEDQEAYRFNFVLKNNNDRDDFSALMELGRAFALTGAALDTAADRIMDVDTWMRTFALLSLAGVADTYNMGLAHNLELYVRPDDGKVIPLPWDVDHGFYYSPRSNILGIGSSNLAKVIARPANQRLFYKHLLDLVDNAYNVDFVTYWANHFTEMTGQSSPSFFINYVDQRNAYVRERLASVAPQIPFEITTNGGGPLSVASAEVTLEGTGWIDIDQIELNGSDTPLRLTWLDRQRWQLTVPVAPGDNTVTLVARNYRGSEVGRDTILVTSTEPPTLAAQFVRISEVMYHPADPSAAELLQVPGSESRDYEFVELVNISNSESIPLGGVRFTDGPATILELASDLGTLAPGERAVVVANLAAFRARYGSAPRVLGVYEGNLANGGELIRWEDASGRQILAFTYGDTPPWPAAADGSGPSLELLDAQTPVDQLNDAQRWRASTAIQGSPGTADRSADLNGDGQVDSRDIDQLCGASPTDLTFDLNGDGKVDEQDLAYLVQNLLGTTFGDANLDGVFNSSDFVQVFQAGEYEDALSGNSLWSTGDWNCDGDFTTADLVKAFQAGGFVAASTRAR